MSSLGALREPLAIGVGSLGEKYWIDTTPTDGMAAGICDPLGQYHFLSSTSKLVEIDNRNTTIRIDQNTGSLANSNPSGLTSTMTINDADIILGYRDQANRTIGAAFATNGNIGANGFGFSANGAGFLSLGNIIVDSLNNYIICGGGPSSANIGRGLIAKFNSSKVLQWQKRTQYPSSNVYPFVSDVLSDGSNIYATGYESGTIGGRDGFILKASSTGNLIWAVNTGDFHPNKLSFIDSSSNLIVAGSDRVSGKGIISKVDLSGNLLSQANITASGFEPTTDAPVTALVVDNNNNVIIAGEFQDRTPVPIQGLSAAYVISLNSSLSNSNFIRRFIGNVTSPSGGSPLGRIYDISQYDNRALYITGQVGFTRTSGVAFKTPIDGKILQSGSYVLGNVNISYTTYANLNVAYGNAYTFTSSNITLQTGTNNLITTTSSFAPTTLTIDKLSL
jgi:hypothetical protein